MKKFSLSLLALAALAFTACTNDDVVLTDDATNTINAGGDGYVALTINLPTQASTRATDNSNDTFKDGDAGEYTVNDATLLLFTKQTTDDEKDAKLFAAYSLTNNFENNTVTTNQNVTTKATITQEISRPSDDDGDLYALVVINKDGMLSLTGSGESATGHFGSVTLTPGTTTFGDLYSPTTNAYAADLSKIANADGSNFYMANAPLFSKAGGTTDPTSDTAGSVSTLVKIESSNIKSTASEAESSPAANIYVERGVAKVTVDGSNPSTGEGYLTATINGYTLDLTNTVMCPVRDVDNSDWWGYASAATGDNAVTDKYRFVGSTVVESGADLYRTYWGIDPNYDNKTTDPLQLDSLVGTAPATSTLTSADGSAAMYCMENTFNMDAMRKTETTRVIIAATLNSGTSFFTIGGASTMLDETSVTSAIKSALEGEAKVLAAEQAYTGETDFFSHFTIGGLTSLEASTDSVKYTITFDSEGALTASDFSDNDGEGNSTVLTNLKNGMTDIQADMLAHVDVAYYKDGLAYYPVMIQHFGDTLTPWDEDEVNKKGTASYPGNLYDSSDTKEQNWLGRYGVLRNNWYELNVQGVKSVGYPIVPAPKDEFDDPVDSYIAVVINILSWAKRTQDVTL